MSTEGALGDRKLRWLRRTTGLDIVRAWAWHPVIEWVTADHQHGWYNRQTGELGWDRSHGCYSSCRELFPDQHAAPS